MGKIPRELLVPRLALGRRRTVAIDSGRCFNRRCCNSFVGRLGDDSGHQCLVGLDAGHCRSIASAAHPAFADGFTDLDAISLTAGLGRDRVHPAGVRPENAGRIVDQRRLGSTSLASCVASHPGRCAGLATFSLNTSMAYLEYRDSLGSAQPVNAAIDPTLMAPADVDPAQAFDSSMNKLLRIQNLTVCRGSRPVLDGVDLSVGRAEMVALIGPNGSGKTTLLKCIAGLGESRQGQIHVGGYSIDSQLVLARRQIGFMVSQEKLPNLLTGQQCLQLFAQARGLEDIPDASRQQVEQLGLTPWLDEWVSSFSLGTRQKLSVLLALLGSPPLILLDEPLNGLDPVSSLALKKILKNLVKEDSCSILMATHDLATVEQLYDHVLILLDGRLKINWNREQMRNELARRGQTLEEAIVDALTRQDG